MRKIFIIPICYSGLSLAELPQPLAIFSGLDLNQKDFSQKLFFTLAQELGISELPPIQYRQMREELKEVQEAVFPGISTSPSDHGQAATAEPALEPIHVQILLVLANSYGYTSAVLAEHFKMEEKKIMPLLTRLIEWNYVYASPAGMGHVRYNLTTRGKAYLEESGLT
jgi:DNA-binding MarR family transcriptional regulator